MYAQLIGEKSAGMTAVEIYNDSDELVWSNMWFGNGASKNYYIDGLCEVIDTMRQCADWQQFGGGDDEPTCYDTHDTTGVMLEYHVGDGWILGDDARLCGHQSSEIIDALMLTGDLSADDEHIGNCDDGIVQAIAQRL